MKWARPAELGHLGLPVPRCVRLRLEFSEGVVRLVREACTAQVPEAHGSAGLELSGPVPWQHADTRDLNSLSIYFLLPRPVEEGTLEWSCCQMSI